MKIYETLEQGTPEWFKVRLGKFTASSCYAIGMEGLGKGKGGLETLCLEKASEILTQSLPEQFENEDIIRGHELEQEARAAYELETGENVKQVGFIEVNEFVGCSPDGLVGNDGLIECKAKNDKNHLLMLLKKEIDVKYQWQMQMQLLCSQRKWVDFLSYNPRFSKTPLIIIRVERNPEMIQALEKGLEKGVARIKEILAKVG